MTMQRQRGLTIVELVVFIVIVGIAVTGVLHVISQNVASSADPIRRKQAMAIAESLMDEVRSAASTFCDPSDANVLTAAGPEGCATTAEAPGPEPGATRPFDNVNDYGTPNGAPQTYATDAAGTPFPAGYAATVTVRTAGDLGPAGAVVPATEALQIVVAVTYGDDTVTLESYRTRFAPTTP